LTSFQPHCGPGVDSASNKNVVPGVFPGGIKVAEADNPTTTCADCLEIWEPQPPGTLWDYPGI